MAPQELIISAPSAIAGTSATRTTATPSIHLHDLLTSSSVQSFKTSASSTHSVAYVPTQRDQGGAIFAVQEGKALANVFAWQKDQMHMKLHLPEKMTCFAVSPNGFWAAAGSPNGQVYLWELSSGLLLSSHTAHYRAVTSLTFTPDSRILLTTSLDSSAHVYLVSRLIDPEDPASAGKPYGSLSDHTLAVRCAVVGKVAGSQGGRCWTASDDGTVKMWSLAPPFDLLCTFALPPSTTPSTLAVDPSERFFYVATEQGDVYHIPLFRKRGVVGGNAMVGEEEEGDWEAVGGGGSGAVPVKTEGAVISTKTPITSLALSLSSTHLLLGTSAGTIQIHSLPSHQHLRTLSPHSGPVTYLSTLLRPADLISGPASASGAGGKVEQWPLMEIKNLERMKTRAARESQETTLLLRPPPQAFTSLLNDLRPRPASSISSARGGAGGNDLGEKVEALESENKRLRVALERAGKVNERMWKGIVDMKVPGAGAGGAE
ncbi:hypothetical protein IAT38_003551 [Cryptococcus sp. DSM 104549]